VPCLVLRLIHARQISARVAVVVETAWILAFMNQSVKSNDDFLFFFTKMSNF
jgi:hypothetical protein